MNPNRLLACILPIWALSGCGLPVAVYYVDDTWSGRTLEFRDEAGGRIERDGFVIVRRVYTRPVFGEDGWTDCRLIEVHGGSVTLPRSGRFRSVWVGVTNEFIPVACPSPTDFVEVIPIVPDHLYVHEQMHNPDLEWVPPVKPERIGNGPVVMRPLNPAEPAQYDDWMRVFQFIGETTDARNDWYELPPGDYDRLNRFADDEQHRWATLPAP